MSSNRLNPRLARISYKLQHWLISIVYLPGELNTMADALSREERAGAAETTRLETPQQEGDANRPQSQRMPTNRGIHLVAGDVKGTPPQGTGNRVEQT